MGRVDIIVGKLKPMGDKPSMQVERKPDAKQSEDFVQKIDMNEEDMMYEAAGDAILSAIKQSDAKALGEALCNIMEMHDAHEMGESPEEEDTETKSGKEY
jgi:hypothetical protein